MGRRAAVQGAGLRAHAHSAGVDGDGGGTTFHFLEATPADALAQAASAAGGKDVRIGGGPTVVRAYLEAGLVDRLHVAITPILLGRGIRLWDGLRGLEAGYAVKAEPAESGVIHLTFQR